MSSAGRHRHRLTDSHRARADADLRTDLPRYRVFSDGALVDEPTDVTRYWRDDLVSFLLGCSFTFEFALAAAGLPLAHQRQGVNVPMYVTDRPCVGAGPFEGPLVVSMRPFAPDDVARAVADLLAASLPCTADRSMSAIPPRSASPISTRPTSANR